MSGKDTLLEEPLFVVYDFPKKIRCGLDIDGGYVIADVETSYDCLLSAGIAANDDFSVDFIKKYNLQKHHCFGFDGSIDNLPTNLQDKMTFVRKHIGSDNNDATTNLESYVRDFHNVFLKMDIEGGEWAWLRGVDEATLNKLTQVVLELHGTTSTSWHGLTIDAFGSGYAEKRDCLKKLSKTHYLVHAHGNNADCVASNGLPNVLEVVYLRKTLFKEPPSLNREPLPRKGLDFPNEVRCPDYDLNFFPFVLKPNPFLLDAPDKEDYTVDDYAILQAQLKEKTIDAELHALYAPQNSFYTEPDFRNRISRGITQTILDGGTAPTKTLYTIGTGGSNCVVCCVPYVSTVHGVDNNTRCLASRQIVSSLEATGFQGHFYLFTGGFPNPTGTEMKYAGVPYSFKIFMMLEAEKKGFAKVLWIDAGCFALNNPAPLFAALDADAVVAKTVQPGNHWKAMVLPQTARLLNYLTQTNVEDAVYFETIVFGLNLASPTVKSLLRDYYEMVRIGWPFFSIFPEEVVLSALFHKPVHRDLRPTSPVNRLLQIHETRRTEDQARREGFYFHHKDYSKYKQEYHISFDDGGGRLGNQLFRYVLCKVFALRFGHKYVERSKFCYEDCLVITEETVGEYLSGAKSVKNQHILCRGYFQKSEYFVKDREALRLSICDDKNDDVFVMDHKPYSIKEILVQSAHSVPLRPEDVVMSVRLDDFLQLPCPTSDILPPTYYLDALTTLNSKGTLYLVVDTLNHLWEHKYVEYFKKWKPVVIQNTLTHDIALLRDASTLIHSNSSLCWIVSFLSSKVRRFIPYTPKIHMNQNQSLGPIADTDSLCYVTPLDHDEVYELNAERPSVFPLSFCIPDECVVPAVPVKTSLLASLIPGDLSTYTFGPHQEAAYNQMYRDARFAITKMKGGWDCLRHYEILMNGCIPLFERLEDCPAATLTTYPKELNKDAYALYESWRNDSTHFEAYERLCAKYLYHTRMHCTTSATARYFLSRIKNGDRAKRILLLTGHHGINYNRESLWIGLKRHIQGSGGTAVEYDKMPFLYDDFDNTVPNKYYGANRFTFPKRLQKDADYEMSESEIVSKIQENFWDLIVYGKVGPDEFCTFPFFDLVKQKYNRNKIAFVFGGDEIFDLTAKDDAAYHVNMFNQRILYKPYRDYLNHYAQYGTCFVRELNMCPAPYQLIHTG
jgi:hypothetical protein